MLIEKWNYFLRHQLTKKSHFSFFGTLFHKMILIDNDFVMEKSIEIQMILEHVFFLSGAPGFLFDLSTLHGRLMENAFSHLCYSMGSHLT